MIITRNPPKKKHPQKRKTMFWGLLGSRHVQTSLENIVFAFPTRIENCFHKQAAAAALCLLLCSWPVRLGFCFDATCIIFINMVPSRNPSKVVVVSHCISTRLPKPGARAIGAASTECLNQHAPKKTAATTRFHWTFGGLLIGLASLAIRS